MIVGGIASPRLISGAEIDAQSDEVIDSINRARAKAKKELNKFNNEKN